MNAAQALEQIDFLYGTPLNVLSETLRGQLIAEDGYEFIAADSSAIESRKLNWLAGQEDVLEIYRGDGKVYEFNASGIYGVPISKVTSEQRQIGKVAELALGFQGGKSAFQSMAKNYGVKVPDRQAEAIKVAWRENHPKVVQYWYALEKAAIAAVAHPGEKFGAGAKGRQVIYKKQGSFLWCRLPSGRVLCYPYPKLEEFQTPWGEMKTGVTYMGMDSYSHKWTPQKAYGGLFSENVTQGSSACLLRYWIKALELKGYPVVMHSHDEIVCELPKGKGSVEEMESIMKTPPPWAAGLPLDAKGWRGKRYRKA